MSRLLKSTAKGLAAAAGVATGFYAAYVATTWTRYGTPSMPKDGATDPRLDQFMPVYDVVERHHIAINAPAATTFACAQEMKLTGIPAIRAIFAARERILGASPGPRSVTQGIVEETRALGWVILDLVPGREIVMGAVTRPWEANVTFSSIPPEQFAAFNEPDYVKIVWNLRADPVDEHSSIFRTETRALATNLFARRQFRRYWAFLSPGIILIRWLSLAPLKADAERRARGVAA